MNDSAIVSFAHSVSQPREAVTDAQLVAAGVDLASDFPDATAADFRPYPVLSDAFDVVRAGSLLPVDPDIYAKSTPVGGLLDPQTKLIDPNGIFYYFASRPLWQTAPHTSFRHHTGGGGGWGDPLLRDPERVKRDVRDEYIAIAGAYRDYGVAVTGDPIGDPENLQIDLQQTTQRRQEMRAQR